jgi:hypothetical protein
MRESRGRFPAQVERSAVGWCAGVAASRALFRRFRASGGIPGRLRAASVWGGAGVFGALDGPRIAMIDAMGVADRHDAVPHTEALLPPPG